MQIQQIIILSLVVFTAQSSALDFYTCQNTCESYNCSESICLNYDNELMEYILSFQEQTCIDYVYTKVTPTTNSELATQFADCIDAYAATITGNLKTLSQCISDCVLVEDSEYDNFYYRDQFDNLQEADICLYEVVQTSDSCKIGSPCFENFSYDVRQVEIENQISDCEELRLNYNLTKDQQNQLISNCFSSYATIMTQENVSTPNTYSNGLIQISQGYSDCITIQNHNLAALFNNGDDEVEEEDPNQDCKANFCTSEFSSCFNQCFKQCETNNCFGDTTNGYISYYAESECQTALLQINQLRKDKDYIDSNFQTSYLSCIEQLETTYATDSKVLEYLSCSKVCKDKKPVEEEEQEEQQQQEEEEEQEEEEKEEEEKEKEGKEKEEDKEKEESGQVISFVGSCLILIFLII